MHRPLVRTALAVVLANLLSATAHAADEAAVIVTATRFAAADPRVPANVSVITRDDIRRAPAATLPDILKTYAGIDASSLYGNMGIDATVDVRGFGDTATSNTLILLDGERINPIDSGMVGWSAIPLASIQRVEIIRGSGTVLYGDRASGGVINIVTDKSPAAGATVTPSIGTHGQQGLDAMLKGGGDAGYFNVFAHHAADGGWRQNTHQTQQTVSGRGSLYLHNGEAFVNYALYQDANGLPNALPTAIFSSDPKRSFTPNDKQERNGYRLRPGVKLSLDATLDMEAELSRARENQYWNNASYGSTSERRKETTSLTPRLRWRHGLGGMDSESVAGLDYYTGDIVANYSAPPDQSARQTSQAVYLQNSTFLDESWSVALGMRAQRMQQSAHQDAFTDPRIDGSTTRRRDAFDAGVAYAAPGWRAYGKLGSTFRFANTDELFGFNPLTYQSIFAGDLRPQHGTIGEIGGSVDAGPVRGRASLYRLDLTDEIGFDTATSANVNFDPTRRQGLEAELEWRPAASLKARLAYTHTAAEFRSGPYAGKRVPLVARDKATMHVSWDTGATGNYAASLNVVGPRPYSGDFSNATGRLPGYATLDLGAAWQLAQWTVTAKLNNALDKRYATWGNYITYTPSWFTGPAGADHWFYPADGRSFNLSARYDFK